MGPHLDDIEIPAETPDGLVRQIEDRLAEMDASPSASAAQIEAALRQFFSLAWRRVHHWDAAQLRSWLPQLTELRAASEKWAAGVGGRARAAVWIEVFVEAIQTAIYTLGADALPAEIRDRNRPPSERTILLTLLDSRARPLSRGDVAAAAKGQPGIKGTGRVGQILDDLHDRGLLLKERRPRRGGTTAHYALSASGVEACRQLVDANLAFFRQPPAVEPSRSQTPAEAGPCQVFSFYSLRGGEERTRLLVHTALQIRAKRRYLQSTDSVVRPILVADMDIHAPALSDYFRCEDGDARGLVGLASDYTRAPAPERLDLLRAGLLSEQYVHRVHEGLYLLPVGRKGENGFLHLRQWIEAFARGRVDPKDPPTLADGGFLGDLRRALVETFFMVLVDSAPGLSDSSYASTVGIADAVVVSLRPSRSELEGSRVLVESMRWRQGDLGGVKGWTPIIPALIEEESMVASSQEAFFRQDVEPAFFPRQTTTAPVGTTSSWYPQPTWIDLGEDSDLRRMCPQLTGRKFYLRARASLAEEIRGIRGASQVAACTRAMLDPDRDSLWHQVATGAMVVPSSESACVQRQMRVSAERAISQGSGGRGRIELVEQNAQRLLKHKRVEVDV